MILVLLALAVAPCLALILFIYLRDKYDREPLGLLLASFLLGAVSIGPAIIVELMMRKSGFISSHIWAEAFIGVGLVEEGWKLFFVFALPWRRKAFNEPFDGIVYAVMVSMGFAMFENIMYVVQGGLGVAVMRMFTAVPAHATFAVIMGYFLGYARFSKKNEPLLMVLALLVPTLFHGAYDYFLMENSVQGLWAGAILSLIVGIILSFRAISIHRKGSPFRQNIVQDNEDSGQVSGS